jgi:hypothetical protein
MLSGLVAALALGFVSGPSTDHRAVTEMRLAYHRLIVGTWERRKEDGRVVAWTFRRNGECTLTVTSPDGIRASCSWMYRVDDKRAEISFGEGTLRLMRLDRRVLAWRTNVERTAEQFRRR